MNKIIRNIKTKERFIEIAKTIPNPTKLQFNTNTKELEIGNNNGVVIYKFKEESTGIDNVMQPAYRPYFIMFVFFLTGLGLIIYAGN